MKILNNCSFQAGQGGTGSFVVTTVMPGAMLPVTAGVVDGGVYSYVARTADQKQWEIGRGNYSSSGTSFTRTAVIVNSDGTNTAVNFSAAPVVSIDALVEDFPAIFDTVAGAQSSSVPPLITNITTRGYYTGGDLGAATYARVATQPTHSGKIQTHDGSWWEIRPVDDWVRYEQFGAKGDGTTDDSVAITGMATWGRGRGVLRVRGGGPGKIYTNQNAYCYNSIPYIEMDGQGAGVMNPRGTSQPITTFLASYYTFGNALPFFPNNYTEWGGGQDLGTRIMTVPNGSMTIQSLDGSTFPRNGRILIYSHDRMHGSASYPPCPTMFEYNSIVGVSGSIATLRVPTRYPYDSRSPEATPNDNNRYGAARFVYLDRPAGYGGSGILTTGFGSYTDYGYNHPIEAIIRNFNFVPNYNFTAQYCDHCNGYITPLSAEKVVVKNCIGNGIGITMSADVLFEDCEGLAAPAPYTSICHNGDCEIDKLLNTVIFRRCKVGSILMATALYELITENCEILNTQGAIPIRSYRSRDDHYRGGGNGNSASIFADSSWGTDKVLIDRPMIEPASLSRTVLYSIQRFSANFVSPNPSQIKLTRAQYDASSLAKRVFPNKVFHNLQGMPAFRMIGMPYCPIDQVTGDVWIDGETVGNMAPTSLAIAALTWSGNVATVQTAVGHGLATGYHATSVIAGVTPAAYNGTFEVTATDATHFTYSLVISDPGPATVMGTYALATLALMGIPDLEIRDPCFIGPYTEQIGSVFGNTVVSSPFPVTRVRDRYTRDDGVWLSSDLFRKICAANRAAFCPGRHFMIERLVLEVTRAGPVTSTLNLRQYDGAGNITTLLNSVDLTTLGRRTLDATGFSNLGLDNVNASPNGLQSASAHMFDFTDSSASFNIVNVSFQTIAWAGGVVTATLAAGSPHGYPVGAIVKLSVQSVAPAGYNGIFACTITGVNTFTYPLTTNPGAGSGGYYTRLAWIPLNIQSINWASGVVTVATTVPHMLTVGYVHSLAIGGCSAAALNGIFDCTIIDASTFTYALTSNPGSNTVLGTVSYCAAMSQAHGIPLGTKMLLDMLNPSVTALAFNGRYMCTILDTQRFTFPMALDPGGASAGTQLKNPYAAAWQMIMRGAWTPND